MPEFHLTAKKTQTSELMCIENLVTIFIHNDDVCIICNNKLQKASSVKKVPSTEEVKITIIIATNLSTYIIVSKKYFNEIIAYINQDLKENEQFNPNTVSIRLYEASVNKISEIQSRKKNELLVMEVKEIKCVKDFFKPLSLESTKLITAEVGNLSKLLESWLEKINKTKTEETEKKTKETQTEEKQTEEIKPETLVNAASASTTIEAAKKERKAISVL